MRMFTIRASQFGCCVIHPLDDIKKPHLVPFMRQSRLFNLPRRPVTLDPPGSCGVQPYSAEARKLGVGDPPVVKRTIPISHSISFIGPSCVLSDSRFCLEITYGYLVGIGLATTVSLSCKY